MVEVGLALIMTSIIALQPLWEEINLRLPRSRTSKALRDSTDSPKPVLPVKQPRCEGRAAPSDISGSTMLGSDVPVITDKSSVGMSSNGSLISGHEVDRV